MESLPLSHEGFVMMNRSRSAIAQRETPQRRPPWRVMERLHRAFSMFLTIPFAVVFGFLLVGLAAYAIDRTAGPEQSWDAIWMLLGRYVGDTQAATALLSTLAGGLITVTSITFSILLLAVQQGASALTNQIFDQYLQRPANQVYFGLFVGSSLYMVETLAFTNDSYHPVLGVAIAVLITAAALCALVPLIYSTIDQTKPVTIIGKIHDVALNARQAQQGWLCRTIEPVGQKGPGRTIASDANGYVTRLDISRLERAAGDDHAIELCVSLGDFVSCGDLLAIVRPETRDRYIEPEIRRAVVMEEQRDLGCDASFGVDQLAAIAWTATSTAKSNPAAAIVATHALHDLLQRWVQDGSLLPERPATASIQYHDSLSTQLMDGFESLIVVASESMQHQSLAAVMRALVTTFPDQPGAIRDRVESILLRSLAVLGDHAPTRLLEVRFGQAVDALVADGRHETANALHAAWDGLAATRGTLHSRSSRG